LTFLSKGNFLSEPWVVGACLGFSSFVYVFLTNFPGIGFTSGALVFGVGFTTLLVVDCCFVCATLLTVVDYVLVDAILFFLAKSTVDGSLFNWTEDVVPLLSYFCYSFGV
jgi:hypothetical protein